MRDLELKETSRPASLISRAQVFTALSRTQHSAMELATPALAALLMLGTFPDGTFIALALLTAFAGYTAVYGLNDLMDRKVDLERATGVGFLHPQMYLESGPSRHPLAQGRLGLASGLVWVGLWSAVALTGAYFLHPICALIFILGAVLEAVYCLMLRISPARTLIHGIVKTCGAMAAVFAVTPRPGLVYPAVLFAWLYFWEIGGQNIPADWHDLDEDRHLKAKTVPLVFGPRAAGVMSMIALVLSTLLGATLFLAAPARPHPAFALAALLIGGIMLIRPAVIVLKDQTRDRVCALFSMASFYPPAIFLLVLGSIIIS